MVSYIFNRNIDSDSQEKRNKWGKVHQGLRMVWIPISQSEKTSWHVRHQIESPEEYYLGNGDKLSLY